MENLSSSTTIMAPDHSVSTLPLSLSLHPSPGVDLCPSVWSFKPIKDDQELSISAIPNLQDFTYTLVSPSTLSNPSLSATICEDFLPYKKRKRQEVEEPKPKKTEEYCSHSTITSSDEGVAKKQRVETPPIELRRPEGDDGHWIKKRLSISDVNNSTRLLLAKDDVKKYVLPLMDEERCAACQSREGLRVKIWDLDTFSEHELSLKQWKTRSFLLTSNWSMEFVKRRNLQEGDCIGLLWDTQHLRFFFQKFNTQS